jgi:hypothetical protein
MLIKSSCTASELKRVEGVFVVIGHVMPRRLQPLGGATVGITTTHAPSESVIAVAKIASRGGVVPKAVALLDGRGKEVKPLAESPPGGADVSRRSRTRDCFLFVCLLHQPPSSHQAMDVDERGAAVQAQPLPLLFFSRGDIEGQFISLATADKRAEFLGSILPLLEKGVTPPPSSAPSTPPAGVD